MSDTIIHGYPRGTDQPKSWAVEWSATQSTTASVYKLNEWGGLLEVPPALYPGYRLTWQAKTASVGTVSVYVGQHGPITLQRNRVNVALDGAIPASGVVDMVFDGTYFQVVSPLALDPLERVVRFDGTVTPKDITNARPAANQLTITGHGLTRGTTKNTVPFGAIFSTAGTLHTGITASQGYYIYVIDANTVSLHTSVQGGIDGTTNLLAITADGTGAAGSHRLRYLTNGATRATLNLSRGVCFVTPFDNTAGNYLLGFEPAFTSATSYGLVGSGKDPGGNSPYISVASTDAVGSTPSASQKQIRVTDDTGAELSPTEVTIIATGT